MGQGTVRNVLTCLDLSWSRLVDRYYEARTKFLYKPLLRILLICKKDVLELRKEANTPRRFFTGRHFATANLMLCTVVHTESRSIFEISWIRHLRCGLISSCDVSFVAIKVPN